MAFRMLRSALLLGAAVLTLDQAMAQEQAPAAEQAAPAATAPTAQSAPATAAPQNELPQVEVIQKKSEPKPEPVQQAAPKPKPKPVQKAEPKPEPKPKPVAKKAAPKPQPAPQAAPEPAPAPEPEVVDTAPSVQQDNAAYGATNSAGAAGRAYQSATTPVNPKAITPQNLEGFSSAATNVTTEALAEQQARSTQEALTRVPGVTIVNDDGMSHHGGIGMRGSPARRSRKVLVMEDGQPLNLALWLDPSVHYIPPLERIEDIEVIRGGTVTHGPNNNHGVINFRNLSPFGANETVISGALGWTDNGPSDRMDVSNKRHVHTRQTLGNVGVVLSYSGAEAEGAWDTEKLTHNDFYGAIGFKGSNQDLTLQITHARQKDKYDESNLEGEEDGEPGEVEEEFFNIAHCKTCYAPGALYNNYNGEITRGQITHNYYLDDDTTITSRVYAQKHRRDRYQIVTAEDNPGDVEDDEAGLAAVFEEGEEGLFNILVPEDSMYGRLRTFRNIGTEVRGELANRPFIGGLTQDIQMGLRYEYQDFKNRNFLGLSGETLEDGDKTGLTIFERNLQSDAVSAFLQTSVGLTSDFKVTPGVRFEWYQVHRDNIVTAEEEGEAEEVVGPDCGEIATGLDECLEIEGINRTASKESYDKFHVLPGVSLAYTGLHKTTLYGGYNRGVSTNVLRNEVFPPDSEIGDNFQAGVRSTAIRGFTFDVAAFHHRIEGYQIQQAFASTAGDKAYGRADLVTIDGVELFGRLDSKPFTGGPWNLYGEASYTYARGIIEKGVVAVGGDDDDEEGETEEVSLAGKHIPETPFHVAALTAGIQHRPANGWNWDASATWTYRGSFFTDELNHAYGSDAEGEIGEVPEVWLLSARFNLDLGNSGASMFIAGDNLTNELYISDREDGLKPGQARTFWTGLRYKF